MKHYTLFKKFLLPLMLLGLLVGLFSSAYIFNHHLNNLESRACEETDKLFNLLTTARALVGEHVLSSMALLKQHSLSLGRPSIQGTTEVSNAQIPNLVFGKTTQTGARQLVDFVTQIGNGTATIFVKHDRHFIRIATNVKKADGSNAFGTELDPQGKAIQRLLDGHPYYGVVDILGESYLSRYEPMHDDNGQLIGAWYVGYKLDFNALDQAIRQWGFLEKGFVAVTDHHGLIRFLTQGVSQAQAMQALHASGGWKIVSRPIPEWDFQINILYPASEAYLSGLGALSPLAIILLVISLIVMLAISRGLRRFVLHPIGGDPETAKQLVARIEQGDFAEDNTRADDHTLIASMLKMRTRLREMVNEIQHNNNRLKVSASVFEHASDAIFITNAQGRIVQCNPSFNRITGHAWIETIGQSPHSLGLCCRERYFFDRLFTPARRHLEWKGEVWHRHCHGHEYLTEMELSPVMNEAGEFQHYVGLFSDITRAKEQQNMLEHMAYHDALTQLPNRIRFSSRLHDALMQAEQQQSLVAICYIDLDEFKIINDQHGHEYGDKLLVMLAERISAMLSESDTLARLGGDEFALLLCGYRSQAEYARQLKKLLAIIEKPFMINTLKFSISASIGYTLYPTDRHPPDTLLRHADHAMYHAKTHGGHQCQLFDLASAQQSQQQQILFKDLLNAIQQHQLRLVYQPQICVHSGDIFCFEALLRWQHPERGLLTPHEFLGIIEHTSLIIDIGHWVMEASLRQLTEWQQQGLHTQVSVNIAAHHLMQKNFPRKLASLFKKYASIAPQQLHLEITETAAINDLARVNRIIRQCHQMGVSFSIDDFGSGYSSLIYLRRLPVDLIKIDKSFVHNMLTNQEDMAVVRGVITLCREFERKVVAEGVEHAEQARILHELGCDYAQGYGISRGLPGHKVVEWMHKNNPYLFH